MPYDKTGDMNPSLKGIKPKITAGQGSLIASWADAMTKEGKVKSPWGVAISKFKRDYTVRGGKWVKRSDLKKENKPMEKPVIVNDTLGGEAVGIADPEVKEDYDTGVVACPVYNALSFKQLDEQKTASDISEEANELTRQFISIIQNNMWSSDVEDKIGALQSVFGEFIARLSALDLTAQSGESMKESLSEAHETEIQEFTELKPTEADKTCLHIDIIPIQPGWGNTRDNHYYPRPMLETCAAKFIGAKMYETDHRDEEKSTKTWVSTIVEMKGFTPDGAPIARVAVHNEDFADRLRRLHNEGILNKMECSILANGSVKPGYKEGDRTGKVVEEISDVISVDWVTRAGAGGQVLSLAESDGGTNMPDKDDEIKVDEPKVETPPAEPQVETSKEVIQETELTPEVKPLTTAEVMAELDKSDLPASTKYDLVKEAFKDVAEISAAVESAKAKLQELYQSGKVTSLGAVAQNKTLDEQHTESEKNKDALAEKAFGRK